jgi:hypothetical protein
MAKFLSVSTPGGFGICFSICLALGVMSAAQAQILEDEAVWSEAEVPPPPAFNLGKLLAFDVPTSPGLAFGVDPAAIQISRADGVVRYVVVATSPSGARNVMYEGLRCATGEFKTYARYSPDGQWKPAMGSEWRSVFGNMPSKHALRFAQAAACDGAASATTVDAIVSRLRYPGRVSN